MRIKAALLAALLALYAPLTLAVPIQHTWVFTATFSNPGIGPVTGRITATLDLNQTMSGDLDAIDLTLGTHTYGVDEVRFVNTAGGRLIIGAKNNGVNSLGSGTDDFLLYPLPFGAARGTLLYSTPGKPLYAASGFTAREVPEPASLALLAAGAAAVGAARRRRAA